VLPPLVVRRWKQLDEWDAAIFLVGLGMGTAGTLALGISPSFSAWAGFVLGFAGLSIRRLVDPRVAAREAEPAATSLSGLGLLLIALGVFVMLLSLLGWGILILSLALAERVEWDVQDVAAAGVPIVGTLLAVAMVRFGRRLRI
jgi:hypothetical protein